MVVERSQVMPANFYEAWPPTLAYTYLGCFQFHWQHNVLDHVAHSSHHQIWHTVLGVIQSGPISEVPGFAKPEETYRRYVWDLLWSQAGTKHLSLIFLFCYCFGSCLTFLSLIIPQAPYGMFRNDLVTQLPLRWML